MHADLVIIISKDYLSVVLLFLNAFLLYQKNSFVSLSLFQITEVLNL